jgi:hypothetical protein
MPGSKPAPGQTTSGGSGGKHFDVGTNRSGVCAATVSCKKDWKGDGPFVCGIQLHYCDGKDSPLVGKLGSSTARLDAPHGQMVRAVNVKSGYVVDSLQFLLQNGYVVRRVVAFCAGSIVEGLHGLGARAIAPDGKGSCRCQPSSRSLLWTWL